MIYVFLHTKMISWYLYLLFFFQPAKISCALFDAQLPLVLMVNQDALITKGRLLKLELFTSFFVGNIFQGFAPIVSNQCIESFIETKWHQKGCKVVSMEVA